VRLWGEHAPLAEMTPAEVHREDLTDLVLAAANADRPARALAFPEPLPEDPLAQAEARLEAMQAIDVSGRATERGRQLFRLPVDATLAHLVWAMPDSACAAFMADLAGALSLQRPIAALPRDAADRERVVEALGRACDATLRVAAVRGREPAEARVAAPERREARRLADRIRALAELPGRDADPEPAETAARALAAAAAALPELAFVRREKRRHALGNGGDEVEIGSQSLFPDDAEAALVLDAHSIPGKGTRRTITIAGCLAPLPLPALASAGLAESTLAAPAWVDGELVARREWHYAGRVIHTENETPDGADARAALADLVLTDELLAPAGERLRDDLDAWALYVRLDLGSGEVPQARAWLVERLARLGVETPEDAALLEPGDLRFEGVPQAERARFERTYPREVRLSGLRMRIHYDVRRRVVTAEKIEGSRKSDPKRWELPAWQGWHVQFQRASRVVDVR
jgi:ATP-dependent helicase HrpB